MTKFTDSIDAQTIASEVPNQRLWAQGGTVRFSVHQDTEDGSAILEQFAPVTGGEKSKSNFMEWLKASANDAGQTLQVQATAPSAREAKLVASFFASHGFVPKTELGPKGGVMIRTPEMEL